MAFGMDAMSEYQPATRRAPMTVAIVSTYPPRPCGIAVFSGDLRNAILGADSSVDVEIVAMVRDGESAGSPHVAARSGRAWQRLRGGGRRPQPTRRRRADRARVRHLRRRGRLYVLSLVDGLTAVRRHPAHGAVRAVRGAGPHPASAVRTRRPVTVFTETARRMVVARLAAPDRVRVVPHGAPDVLSEMAWADSVSDQTPPGVLPVGDQVLPISRAAPCCRPSD